MNNSNVIDLTSSIDRERVLQFFKPFPELILFLEQQQCLEEFLSHIYDCYSGDIDNQKQLYEMVVNKEKGILSLVLTWADMPSKSWFWMMQHNRFRDSRKRKEPKIQRSYKVVRK